LLRSNAPAEGSGPDQAETETGSLHLVRSQQPGSGSLTALTGFGTMRAENSKLMVDDVAQKAMPHFGKSRV
jgi:hypothetical protein